LILVLAWNGAGVDVVLDPRLVVVHVEPLVMPSLVGGLKGHGNVLRRVFLLELKSAPTDHLRGRVVRVTLQAEEVVEEVEMGSIAEVRLIEIDEDGDVNKGVRVEIA
jgi:hypothetical protein